MRKCLNVLSAMAVFGMFMLSGQAAEAQITVTTLSDAAHNSNCGDGICTLREAVAVSLTGDTINFNAGLAGGSLALSATLFMDNGVTIDGSTAPGINVSRLGATRVIWIDTSGDVNPVILNGLTISNGSVSGGTDGAGIFIDNSSVEITNCTLMSNTATGAGSMGGAIAITDASGAVDVLVEDSTISANSTADSGGGIYIEGNTASLSVWNSTITGNSAANGGGIFIDGSTVDVFNTTISGNTTTVVGEASVQGINLPSLTVVNSIIANDTDGVSCGFVPASQTNNIDSGTSCGWGSNAGSLSSTDPLLSSLGDYGGATQTLALLPGSPAINTGAASGGAGTCMGGNDQRGIAGVGNCDIGSFESQGFNLSLGSGDNQSAPIGMAFAAPLVANIAADNAVEPVNGGIVEFRGPVSGAGTSFGGFTTQSISGGTASLGVTANGVPGSYIVTADTTGRLGLLPVSFNLTNTAVVSVTTIDSDTPDPSYPGEAVTVTVTVTGLSPTGTVDITGADTNCSITLTAGTGSCDAVFTASGARTLTATYGGDASNGGSVDTEAHEVFFPPGDSDLDGNADIFWRDVQQGMTFVSYFNETVYSGTFKALKRMVAAPWIMAGGDDFNRDGMTDIFWRNPVTGVNVIAHYQGTTLLDFKIIKSQSPEWRVFGTGDINKDRYPDIFWYNTMTHANEVWYMQDKTFLEAVDLPLAPAPWVPVAVADFDGDTNPDAVALNSVTGRAVIALLSATNLKAVNKLPVASTGWDACGTIDMSGDNMPDIVWRDPMTGANEAWIIQNSVRTSTVALPTVKGPWSCMAGHK